MSNLIAAIDGPSASGKSTVSLQVASHLGWVHVDSGSIYRGLTWQMIREGGRLPEAIPAWLTRVNIRFINERGTIRFRLNEEDPGNNLRAEAVRSSVSAVAACPAIRTWVVDRLRELVRFGHLVMEGRDIGTVVFPDARFKFYLDANPQERARRRYLELLRMEGRSDLETVAQSLNQRDRQDTSREIAPLTAAPDAIRIDTTSMSLDTVVAAIVNNIRRELEAP